MIEKRRTAKKDYIAKVAVDVFFQKGYKESSLEDISNKGKISKAGIYHYFKSKPDILSYALLGFTDKVLSEMNEAIKKAKEKNLSKQQIFNALIETYATCMMRNRKISLIVLRERHQLPTPHKNELLNRERLFFHIVRDQLRQVPCLNKKLNVNIISFQIISMIHWMGYWFDSKGPLSEREALRQMIKIIFKGVLNYKQ
ncbi:MAG: TetR family transcriptional regulator [Syntrophaceae bacterium]|jgi:AcrR family transcriptional regulator|nr:TetR family transcriptional regulator [Syntrophaceae bacterium]